MFHLKWSLFLLLVLVISTTAAQEDCSAQVQAAFEAAAAACQATLPHEVCVGAGRLQVTGQSDSSDFALEQAGDKVSAADVGALHLEPVEASAFPGSAALVQFPGFSLVLWGNVTLENTISDLPARTVLPGTTTHNANVRSAPSRSATRIIVLPQGAAVTVDGRTADGLWLRIWLVDGGLGWVSAELMQPDTGHWDVLMVIDPLAPPPEPMQEFRLSSGLEDAACTELPASGLLIQTQAETVFRVNDISLVLNGTAFVQAQSGKEARFTIIEGQGSLEALARKRTIPAGAWSSVSLDETGQPAAAPHYIAAYEIDAVQGLPLVLLQRAITVAEPRPYGELASVDACEVTAASVVYLRSGPGPEYPRRDRLQAGESRLVVGQAQGQDGYTWWKLRDTYWVRADGVTENANCATISTAVAIPPTPFAPPQEQFSLQQCFAGYKYRAGVITLNVNYGGQVWKTCAEAEAAGQSLGPAAVTGTGPAPSRSYTHCNCFSYEKCAVTTEAEVRLSPGTYTYNATWGSTQVSCTFEVVSWNP